MMIDIGWFIVEILCLILAIIDNSHKIGFYHWL